MAKYQHRKPPSHIGIMLPKLTAEVVVQNPEHGNMIKGGQVPRSDHSNYFG